jgi:uncharacterized protein YndB with AHSA1/START domain
MKKPPKNILSATEQDSLLVSECKARENAGMNNSFAMTVAKFIPVPPARVWEALTNPELVKKYFFGVSVESSWEVGSPILYKGVWEGKEFVDKGEILKIEPEKKLQCSYWSSFSGLSDEPDNYQRVTYTLTEQDKGTLLTITQDYIPTQESADHSKKNWQQVLENMKKMLAP